MYMGCLELFEACINAGTENPIRHRLSAAGVAKRANDCEVSAGTTAHFVAAGAAILAQHFARNPGDYLPWFPANHSFGKMKGRTPSWM